MIERWRRGAYLISTDPKKLDFQAAHAYLSRSYWGKGRGFAILRKAMRHSICFGLYKGKAMVGLARAVTDQATYAYLCDVYIRPDAQGEGLGKWLMSCVMKSKALKSVRGWHLKTKDAHGLYRRFGFGKAKNYRRWMQYTRA